MSHPNGTEGMHELLEGIQAKPHTLQPPRALTCSRQLLYNLCSNRAADAITIHNEAYANHKLSDWGHLKKAVHDSILLAMQAR